ncbi:uncharacterized protein LOC126682828 [Mercurialis annua]|uniref:uncharacterized protein LOC126682828 n=1 Tax=Mercurialis annua TaxID=3986 RepID=UPI002160BBC4|nr:uncharacterized protein LOC126682828 [Mercurialis annua]
MNFVLVWMKLFVATCSPSRDSCGHYEIWGHSTMVGPFGEVIASCGDEETLLVAEIDNTYLQIVRESFAGEDQLSLPIQLHF